jgi:hypothetical protein
MSAEVARSVIELTGIIVAELYETVHARTVVS